MNNGWLTELKVYGDFNQWKQDVILVAHFDGIYGPDRIGMLTARDIEGEIIGTYDMQFDTGTIWQ